MTNEIERELCEKIDAVHDHNLQQIDDLIGALEKSGWALDLQERRRLVRALTQVKTHYVQMSTPDAEQRRAFMRALKTLEQRAFNTSNFRLAEMLLKAEALLEVYTEPTCNNPA